MSKTIAYYKNGIGNLVEMSPALQALSSMDSTGKIDVCLDATWNDSRRSAIDDIFSKYEFVNKIINFPKDKLEPKKYKLWFYTMHSEGSAAFNIFQEYAKPYTNRLNWKHSYTHEVDYYMEAVTRLGFKGRTPSLNFPCSDPHINLKNSIKPLIGLCNGAFGKQQAPKRYPHFRELSKILKSYFNCTIIKLGYQKELSEIDNDENTLDFVGKLSITETGWIIKQLDLFITTDTALMHIADALNVNQIVLFGGSLVSKNGPLSKNATVITAGEACQPCQYVGKFDTCKDVKCMRNISIGEIMGYAKLKL